MADVGRFQVARLRAAHVYGPRIALTVDARCDNDVRVQEGDAYCQSGHLHGRPPTISYSFPSIVFSLSKSGNGYFRPFRSCA